MKIITVNNSVNGGSWRAKESRFDSLQDMYDWRDEKIANNTWGKPDRWLREENFTFETIESSEDSRVIGEGEEAYTEYFFSCDYEIVESDWVEDYAVSRKREYMKIEDLLKEALVEKELGDSDKWDEYIILRNQIKADFPKPE